LLRALLAKAPPARAPGAGGLAGAPAWAGKRGDELLDLVTDHLADAYSDIRLLPDVPARLEALRHRFFSDTDTEEIRATARGYEIALRECPAGALALECRDLCRIVRGVLRELTGCPVEQSQWIARGDPRCVFEIITACVARRAGTADAEAKS
jgi:predicted ArsR family transcriptional regulator